MEAMEETKLDDTNTDVRMVVDSTVREDHNKMRSV